MALKVSNLVLEIKEDNLENLKSKVATKLGIEEGDFNSFKIIKESIDARKKSAIKINYAVEITCDNEEKVIARANSNEVKAGASEYNTDFNLGKKKMQSRPVIIGMGPAGLFAGLLLAEKGYSPLIIERGEDVDNRTKSIEGFWSNRVLNTNSNVQFGEGGAGTFSDGKLTTRIKDHRCGYVLEELVLAGAPEEITYMGKPHIGTDILKDVVKNIREKIKAKGGEVRFSSKLEDIEIRNNKIYEITVNGEKIPCDNLILATGHSARDTYEMLFKRGVSMSPKPFAIGFRIEHLQQMIDENQYGKFATHPKLRAADYKLAHTSKQSGRGVYSFCMCPGGHVVASASEENTIVVNGMSNYKRDGKNANSAIVVSIDPKDFSDTTPLGGIEFQRHYESLAYKLGGGNYNAPVQLVKDFLNDEGSKGFRKVKPTYTPGTRLSDLRECAPKFVVESIKEALPVFNRKIPGYTGNDALLTGVETRTSAPVKINRNENHESINVEGLYPTGEGAGYAGGIISAAVDGLHVAEKIITEYSPK
ncbi:NAD(P)/FAD-dependent oxidoreductase [Clostridium sp.]|uniref:NAD(P)/FAD-dependent oxidoreductase n=1 Tax=Clostridium sp. TaxID=1506 RepID=UPI003216B1E7